MRLEVWGTRMLSLRRARAYATVAIALFVAVYLLGLATRHGLVDGFGHVIGRGIGISSIRYESRSAMSSTTTRSCSAFPARTQYSRVKIRPFAAAHNRSRTAARKPTSRSS